MTDRMQEHRQRQQECRAQAAKLNAAIHALGITDDQIPDLIPASDGNYVGIGLGALAHLIQMAERLETIFEDQRDSYYE